MLKEIYEGLMKDRKMKLRRPMHFVRAPLFFAATLSLALNYNGALADFAEGLEAFDGGDFETAVANWQEDVEAGNVEAMTALADLYTRGTGVPQSWQKAAELYQRAASYGDKIAQLNLGEFYQDGLGVEQNRKQAAFWLTLAAQQGSDYAAQELAHLLISFTVEEQEEISNLVADWKSLLPLPADQ